MLGGKPPSSAIATETATPSEETSLSSTHLRRSGRGQKEWEESSQGNSFPEETTTHAHSLPTNMSRGSGALTAPSYSSPLPQLRVSLGMQSRVDARSRWEEVEVFVNSKGFTSFLKSFTPFLCSGCCHCRQDKGWPPAVNNSVFFCRKVLSEFGGTLKRTASLSIGASANHSTILQTTRRENPTRESYWLGANYTSLAEGVDCGSVKLVLKYLGCI